METAFSTTLLALLFVQSLLSLLLLGPWVIAKPVVRLYQATRAGAGASAATYTVGAALLALCVSSSVELFSAGSTTEGRDIQGGLLAKLDRHRAWLSATLAAVNLIVLFVNRAFAKEKFEHDRAKLNLETMLRQVKGLQSEYNRVTAEAAGSRAVGEDRQEAAALQRQVQQLHREMAGLQERSEAAQSAASRAEARLSAMVAQVKGMDKEYDRLLAENAQLQRQLAQYEPSYSRGSKKDS